MWTERESNTDKKWDEQFYDNIEWLCSWHVTKIYDLNMWIEGESNADQKWFKHFYDNANAKRLCNSIEQLLIHL